MVVNPGQIKNLSGQTRFIDGTVASPRSFLSKGGSPLGVDPELTMARPNLSLSPEQLELSARLIDICQQYDFSSISHDLKYRLGLNPSRLLDNPTVSGLSDFDFPSLESLGLNDVREFVYTSPTRIQPLPQELQDQFPRMQCNCALGLFPEISRAWVTVDSDLFVWNYETNGDLAYFDGVSNTILLIGLVPPKLSAFSSRVPAPPFLLCVVTAVDILLFAITFTDADGQPVTNNFRTGEMHLMPDPLYRLPLDGAIVTDIASTSSGRIFLTARDCCLYEVDYQPQSLLFGKSCKKINYSKGIMSYLVPSFVAFTLGKSEPLVQAVIDDSRHILYTRSESGSIQAFDLGADGQQPATKITALSASEIQHYAAQIARTVEPSNFKPIVFLSPITCAESTCLNLVGITQSGVRLFFTCYFTDPAISMPSQIPASTKRPVTLRLVHVRLPPGFTANTSVARPKMVHYGYLKRDLAAFVSVESDERDAMWLLSSAQFGFAQRFVEVQANFPVRGRTWAMAESTDDGTAGGLEWFEFWRKRIGNDSVLPRTIVTQHMEGPRRLIALTVQGIHVFERLRPVDILRTLLLEFGPSSHQVRSFFELYHPNQACIMCVMLACSTSHQNAQVVEKAVRALYAFGGEPVTISAGRAAMEQAVVTPFSSGYDTFQQNRLSNIPATNPGDLNLSTALLDPAQSVGAFPYGTPMGGGSGRDVRFSSRHNGLYGYFGRIIGPLWQGTMITEGVAVSPSGKHVMQINSTLSASQLQWISDQLRRFSDFLSKEIIGGNVTITRGLSDTGLSPTIALTSTAASEAASAQARERNARRAQGEAVAAERQSLLQLNDLVHRCREIFGLWRVLSDHQVHVVLSFLPKDLLETLKTATLRNLVVAGKELCTDVITCIISTYLGDSAATDAVSERLRDACPSLFTSDDATAAKASELLQFARSIDDAYMKSKTIADAMTMYKRVAANIHLPTVCIQLEEVDCYDGIIDLVLCAAQKIDPQNTAIHYLKIRQDAASAASVVDDGQSAFRQAFVSRMCCYKPATDTLSHLLSALAGRHPKLTPHSAQEWMDRMLKMIFDSTDELFHYATFEWMVENRLQDQLIYAPSAYLEGYLLECINTAPSREGAQYLNLLWRLYEKDGRFTQAAQLLVKLAERHSTDLTLNERIEYLARAVVCAKASTSVSTEQAELLHELEDKLEVAKLQSHIVETLQQVTQPPDYVREAIAKLNAELMDVTTLYGDYAEVFNLSECKLAIIQCAGHHDPMLVETLWKEIIDTEMALSVNEFEAVRSKLLSKKLSALATHYHRSPQYFPKEFLRKYLLVKSNEIGLETENLRQFIVTFLRGHGQQSN